MEDSQYGLGSIIKLHEFTKNRLWKQGRLDNNLCSYGIVDKVGPNDWLRIKFKNTRRRFKLEDVYIPYI